MVMKCLLKHRSVRSITEINLEAVTLIFTKTSSSQPTKAI